MQKNIEKNVEKFNILSNFTKKIVYNCIQGYIFGIQVGSKVIGSTSNILKESPLVFSDKENKIFNILSNFTKNCL